MKTFTLVAGVNLLATVAVAGPIAAPDNALVAEEAATHCFISGWCSEGEHVEHEVGSIVDNFAAQTQTVQEMIAEGLGGDAASAMSRRQLVSPQLNPSLQPDFPVQPSVDGVDAENDDPQKELRRKKEAQRKEWAAERIIDMAV